MNRRPPKRPKDYKATTFRLFVLFLLICSAGLLWYAALNVVHTRHHHQPPDDVVAVETPPPPSSSITLQEEAKMFLAAIDLVGILAVLQTDEAEVNRRLETRSVFDRVKTILASLNRRETLPEEEKTRIKAALASHWSPGGRHAYFGKSQLFVHRDRFQPRMTWDETGDAIHHSPDPTMASLPAEAKKEVGKIHGDWRVLRDFEIYTSTAAVAAATPRCLVYSFGIHREWQFDDFTSQFLRCETHSFDPMVSDGKQSGLNYRELHQAHAIKHNIPDLHFHFLGLDGDSPPPGASSSSSPAGVRGTFDGSSVDKTTMKSLPEVSGGVPGEGDDC